MTPKYRRTLCPCAHGIEHHPERGPCTYGTNTVFGGCRCPAFGTRKSKQPSGPVDADESAIDKWVRDVNLALATLASGMKDILRRRREALASGDIDARVVLVQGSQMRKEAAHADVPVKRNEAPATLKPHSPVAGAFLSDAPLSSIARLLLVVCAQRRIPLTRKQILLFANRRQSGDTSTAFARLIREHLLVDIGGRLSTTEEGRQAAQPFDPLPTGRELRMRLLEQSDPFTRAVLGQLFDAYPEPLTRAELLDRTNYAQSGDTSTAFARLVTCGYAAKIGKGALAAAPELFT